MGQTTAHDRVVVHDQDPHALLLTPTEGKARHGCALSDRKGTAEDRFEEGALSGATMPGTRWSAVSRSSRGFRISLLTSRDP